MHARFNEALRELHEPGGVNRTMGSLIRELDGIRNSLRPQEWRRWIDAEIRPHALYPVLLEDPFVHHSATRPRGYPGDAELLDYIYGSANVQPKVERSSALGKRLYAYSYQAAAPAAVRHRRTLTAAEIDRLAAGSSRPHILSVACGHLREAASLRSLRGGQIGRFVALDQDPLSLDLVRREWARSGVEAVECSAKALIRGGSRMLGRFDFIYALGLYDYLSDETAARLLATLVDMLHPGGKVWIANFVSGLWTTGYMEAVMDWWLVYRSTAELEALAGRIEPSTVASQRVFLEPVENVAFLELVKA
jgi:extracellular factor (EF) 3-hydroxypalmitic acid methyl ester biosynthesis protein